MEKEITVEEIQRVICKQFKVNLGDLKSKKRLKNIILARHVAMYLCRKHTSMPSAFIGFKFGGRNHSTVLHASKKPRKEIKTKSLDPDEHYSIGKRPPSRPNPLSRSAKSLRI